MNLQAKATYSCPMDLKLIYGKLVAFTLPDIVEPFVFILKILTKTYSGELLFALDMLCACTIKVLFNKNKRGV